jgi:hypothetical protein
VRVGVSEVRGQLFSMDFLASILVMTVVLGLFLHGLELPVGLYPGASKPAAVLSQTVLSGMHSLSLNSSLFAQGSTLCPSGSKAYCFDLSGVAHLRDGVSVNASLSFLVENGVLLGPAHASLTDVQTLGLGRFWDGEEANQGVLVFSSLDGSNPKTNGLSYVLVYVDVSPVVLDGSCYVLQQGERDVNVVCPLDCRVVDAVDRFVSCGESLCTFSVRSCA